MAVLPLGSESEPAFFPSCLIAVVMDILGQSLPFHQGQEVLQTLPPYRKSCSWAPESLQFRNLFLSNSVLPKLFFFFFKGIPNKRCGLIIL